MVEINLYQMGKKDGEQWSHQKMGSWIKTTDISGISSISKNFYYVPGAR